jgi:tRNA-binding EMAP/Myf-like protein
MYLRFFAFFFKAQAVEGADKLLQLTLDIGEASTKNVFAGIKAHYKQTLVILL